MPLAEPLYMLDTNIVSCLMEPPEKARRLCCQERFDALQGRIAISVIVQAEIFAGLEKTPSPRKERQLRELMRGIQVEYLRPDLWFSDLYACILARLERCGEPLQQFDVAIAAHAMALGATLISNDRGFERVEGLKLENWLAPEDAGKRPTPGVAEPAATYASRWGATRSAPAQASAVWMSRSTAAGYASSHVR
ncbi:PIN domain-containing protein [Mitsuaria sp. 7]|uniref:PIN domain-containing protein n=1 Tax=Mitsuaria sp. 7 TaxID=1658665 RepID=UPI000834671F|nr:PIN domain-containing protein [Mitsuaria sp. 7]